MSEFFSPYDADRPLMLKCSCGRDHTLADHHAEVAADAAAVELRRRSLTSEFEAYSNEFIEATLVNAGNPTVFVAADALGLTARELQPQVNGDAALLEFASPVNAVQCAIDLQNRVAVGNDDEATEENVIAGLQLLPTAKSAAHALAALQSISSPAPCSRIRW